MKGYCFNTDSLLKAITMNGDDTEVVKFVYKIKNSEVSSNEISQDIKIPFHGHIEELTTNLEFQMQPVLLYLEEDKTLRKELELFIADENQKFYDERDDNLLQDVMNNRIDVETTAKDIEKLYKDEIIQFADRIGPSDEEIFAQSFHRLFRLDSVSLEWILAKEKDYAKTITNIMNKMDDEVDSLNSRQQEEMESLISQLDISSTPEDVNNLLGQQYATQNYIRKRYESELEAMRGHQKNEYREWITSQVSKIFLPSPQEQVSLGNRSSMYISQTPSMEESFTIHLGSQLKHMHNIRILSANVTDLCSPLHADENLNGLNTTLGLYSSSLCGVVVLTPSMQAQANKSIIKNSNMSTEFHFDQIETQLEQIEADAKEIYAIDSESPTRQSQRLQTGDFFITKHSNLSQSHVVFHLISDETFNTPSEINSRHPVILGLRNILKTASRHDVTTLTIPALLRHEMSEDMTVQWCMRRAELVFKCAKGFMIESATWGGAELSTLQLLLPHDISEELFITLAGMVPHVFRVTNPKIFGDNK